MKAMQITPVTVVSVHDGDTLRVNVPLSLGLPGITWVPNIRVLGCNAAELHTADGDAALVSVKAWLAASSAYVLYCYGQDKYGRVLGDLTDAISTGRGNLSQYVLTLPGSKPLAAAQQLMKRD